MPAVLRLPGWKPVGGKSRRWQASNGKTVSRRQYENKVLKGKGWRNRYEAEQFRMSHPYKRAKRARREQGKDLTIFDEYSAFLREVDWELVDANWERIRDEGRNRNKSPDGLLAQNLVLEGLREADWEWDVGETASGVTAIGSR